MTPYDKLFINVNMIDAQGSAISGQAIAIKEGRIAWCGLEKDLSSEDMQKSKSLIDGQGQLLTPGLIDCHTHLVYAGNRAHEFKMKLEGMDYAQIAKASGGILSTVRQTRAASEEELIEQSLPRINALKSEGVTTVEIKSGYGLDLKNELKMLTVAKRLGELSGLRVKTTFLGAHVVPPEYQKKSQVYVDYLCKEVMPLVKETGLADAIDVFCETIAFSLKQTEQIFQAAQALKMPIKCHAEQLSNMGATALASRYQALSCDHLEYLDQNGVLALKNSKTVAVLLPGAFYFLGEQSKPPVALLRKAEVGMAIATDSNPGTSPTLSLQLMMSMACRFFCMSIPEVWAGVTYQAARALGIAKELGSIEVGKIADLVLWSAQESAALCYYFGYPIPHRTLISGEWID